MKRSAILATVCLLALTGSILAADWPQFRGTNRDGVSQETGLLKTWPKAGPPLVWTYANAGIGYSGPAVVGDRLYLMGARGESEYVYALDLTTAGNQTVKELWAVKIGPTFNWKDNNWNAGPVYVTAGYGAGCDLIKLIPNGQGIKAEKVYSNKNMVNHHGGVVLVGDYLYGYSDGERGWVCQEFKTGKVVWVEKKKLGKGSLTCADGRLYCYSEDDGTLVLIAATPEGWQESGRFKIPQQTTRRSPQGKIWTHPVVANGHLYLRDQDLLFCYNVKDLTSSAR